MRFLAKAAAMFLVSASLIGCAAGPELAEPRQAAAGVLTPAQLQHDFRLLYDGLQRAHFNLFANRTRSEFDRSFAETLATLDHPMTKAEAQIRFQRFVAQGRVAHARVDAPMEAFGSFRESGGKIFPFEVRLSGGRAYVADNLSGLVGITPGDEIVLINGQPAELWVHRLRRHISADSDYLADAILEPQFTIALWLELGAVDRFEMQFLTGAGTRLNLAVPARTRAEMRAAPTTAGLAIDPAAREARMLPGAVAYLRPGIFMNVEEGADPFDPKAFHRFIDSSFESFIAAGATRLLIDLRDNPGGDNSFSDHMIAWFADRPFRFASCFRVRVSPEAVAANAARLNNVSPDGVTRTYAEAYARASFGDVIDVPISLTKPRTGGRFAGRVFLLVNRRSFSNAVSVAAIVQDYRFGEILGEPTADLATTYGAMETFTLPNSGMSVGFPKAQIIRPSGDERFEGVMPDVVIQTPIVEPADDPVLREALQRLAER